MGEIKRQSIKGTIYSYIGVVLGFVTTGLLYPFVLKEGQIGLLKLLMSYSVLAAQLAGLGFNGVTVRLFPLFRDPKSAHKGFLYLGILVTLLGIFISFIGLAIIQPWILEQSAGKSSLLVEYFNLIYPLIVFQLVFSNLDNYYSQLYKTTFAIFLKEFVQRILLVCNILAYFFGWISFSQFVYIFVIMVSLPTLLLTFQIYRDKQLKLNITLKYIDKELWRQIVKVGLYSILTSFTGVIILNVDSIMISTMVGIGATGIYATNYFFGKLVLIPSRPMIKISNAVISEAWSKNDVITIKDIYEKSTINQTIVASFLLMGLLINLQSIYQYLPPVFKEGQNVLIFIALASWSEMATGVSKSVIGTSAYYMVQSIAMIGLAVLVVITNYIFIPIYGISGAAFASFLSLMVFNLFRYFFIWYKFKMQPYGLKHLLVIFITVGLIFLSSVLPLTYMFYIDIPYRSLIISVMFAVLIYRLKLSEEINAMMDKLIKRIFKR